MLQSLSKTTRNVKNCEIKISIAMPITTVLQAKGKPQSRVGLSFPYGIRSSQENDQVIPKQRYTSIAKIGWHSHHRSRKRDEKNKHS